MDPTLDSSAQSFQFAYGIELPRQSFRLGISNVMADAEQLDRKRRERYSGVRSKVRQQPNERLLEAQRQHAQFLNIIEAGEAGFGLLLSLHEQFGGIETCDLWDLLESIYGNIDTVRHLAKAGLLSLDGELLVLSDQGAHIASRLEQLTDDE